MPSTPIHYDYLRSPDQRVHLIDVDIKPPRLEAGYVHYEPNGQAIVPLEGTPYHIHIPDALRDVRTFATVYFADEPVEFYLADEDELGELSGDT